MQSRYTGSMKLLIVLFFCIVPLVSAKSIKGRETSTCIADYLKSISLMSADLGSNNPPSLLCQAIVDVTKIQILQSVRFEIQNDIEMRSEADCIMENLKKSNFGNNLLLIYVIEASEEIDETEKSEKLNLAKTTITQDTFNSFVSCKGRTKFGEMFDSFLEPKTSSEEKTDPKEDYCIRKRIIENKLITLENVNLQMNPQNIDTSNVDCNIVYQKTFKDAEDDLVKNLLDDDSDSTEEDDTIKFDPTNVACILQTLRQRAYIDHLLQFDYLKDMSLDATKRNQMRNNFIEIMTNVAQSASKCFL